MQLGARQGHNAIKTKIKSHSPGSATVTDTTDGRVAFDLSSIGIRDYAVFNLDAEGRVATWNVGAERLKGYVAAEIIGKHFSIFYNLADVAAGRPDLELAIARRDGTFLDEGRRKRKDGSQFWAGLVITPLWDGDRLLGYSKITRDISDRVEARLQMDAFFELSLDLLVVAGFDGRFRRVNPICVATLGYTREELTSVPWLDFVHPEDVEATLAAGSLLTDGQDVLSFENRYRCKDGSYRWLHWNAISNPERKMVFCIGRDVTERKLAEEPQHLETLRLREQTGLLELAHDAIIVRSMDSAVTFWNRGAEHTYGWTKEQAIGQITHSLFQTQHPIPLEELMSQLADEGHWEGELIHIRQDGEQIILESRMELSRNKVGQPVSIMEINRDVTTLKRAEHAESELRLRTVELNRSNEDLQQFAYVASHDLQEPLRMVTSFVQLLEKKYGDQLDDQARRWIDHAVDGATRMQTLIRDLLEYSRLGSDRRDLTACDMGQTLALSLRNLESAVAEANAIVSSRALPIVVGDKLQLVSLFQNLIGNAIKYRGNRAPVVLISAIEEGPEWRFTVKDNGIGIEPKFSARIFTIFQRLHTRANYPGTGIGLALCKRIVERHGGRIWMDSEPGTGSTFHFTLPAHAKERTFDDFQPG